MLLYPVSVAVLTSAKVTDCAELLPALQWLTAQHTWLLSPSLTQPQQDLVCVKVVLTQTVALVIHLIAENTSISTDWSCVHLITSSSEISTLLV